MLRTRSIHRPVVACVALLACAWLVACPNRANAIAGTDRIAEPGKPYDEQLAKQFEWPRGTLDLVNDPARTFGWNHWFSELPNDVMRFEYRAASSSELNRLIQKLAKIDSKRRQIVLTLLDPPVHEKISAAAEIAVGSQPHMDEWYRHLDPEKRKTVWKLTKPPEALPPTLTIYVRHDAVDLDLLAFPADVDIEIMLTSKPKKGDKPSKLQRQMQRIVEERDALKFR